MLHYQPSKMQAAEGFWEEQSPSPAPYNWIIVPDQAHQRNRFTLGTPVLGSIWLTHSLSGPVAGLKNTPPDRQPIMGMVFYGFHTMFTMAILMFFIVVVSLWLRLQKRLFSTRRFLRALVIMTPAGFIATIAGWYTAETGRQPWVIWGILRTADAVSPVPGGAPAIDAHRLCIDLRTLYHGFPDLHIPHDSTWPGSCTGPCRSLRLAQERSENASDGLCLSGP